MIELTNIGKQKFILNCNQIEKIEKTPESVITLMNGDKFIVRESPQEIIDKTIEYKRKIFNVKL